MKFRRTNQRGKQGEAPLEKNILWKKNGKQKAEPGEGVFSMHQMEKLISLISCVCAAAGMAMASLAFVLWYRLAVLFHVKGLHLVGTVRPVANILFFMGFIFLLLYLLLKSRLKRYRSEISTYPEAELYYRESAIVGRGKILVSVVLCVIGFIFNAFVPLCFSYKYMELGFYIGGSIAVIGAFFSAFFICKQKASAAIKIQCVMPDGKERGFDRQAEVKKVVIRWGVYWSVVLVAYLTVSLRYKNFHMYLPLPALATINFILRMIVNSPFRRYVSLRARYITTRILNMCSAVVVASLYLFIIQNGSDYNNAYIASLDYTSFTHNSSVIYDQKTGVYTVTGKAEEFRILQLTDIHLCASITTISTDRKALDACYALIKEARPDLILVTGDIVFPIPLHTFSNDNLTPIYQFCTFMNNIGIPWAMVYGNHDTEAVAGYNAQELTGIYRYFKQNPDCPMLYTDTQPDIYGRYNQYLRIENADHSLNRLIFLVDSNDYVEGMNQISNYDSVHSNQIQWYADTIDQISGEEGRVIPSFVFMHIPFRAFADAQEALKNGSPDAVYLFGENGEEVCHPDRDSGFFDAILEKKSTQAVFVGHDHLNNMAVCYKGVDLVYSKSIDYIAYPGIAQKTEQRGATLIILLQDGTYQLEQVSYVK